MNARFLKYLLKRIILGLITFVIVVSITFWLMQMVPGNPFLSEKSLTPEQIAERTRIFGLDRPLFVQWMSYIGRAFTMDFGPSIKKVGQGVTDIVFNALKYSFIMGLCAAILALIIGVLLGTYCATHQNKFLDRFIMVITTASVAMPTFVIALLLLYLFAVVVNIFPSSYSSSPGFQALILPIIAESLYPAAYITRLMRSSTLDVLGQDYMRTGKAKGLGPKRVLFKHGIRNSITPVITYFGPMFAFIISGSLVIDQVFQIPGAGRIFQSSITNRDYPTIMAMTCIIALLMIVFTLLSDILYTIVNPRVDFE